MKKGARQRGSQVTCGRVDPIAREIRTQAYTPELAHTAPTKIAVRDHERGTNKGVALSVICGKFRVHARGDPHDYTFYAIHELEVSRHEESVEKAQLLRELAHL